MNLLPGVKRITGDAAVGSSGKPIRVFTVHLVSGATASSLTLKNGTSTSGTAYLQVDGTATLGATVSIAGGMRFPEGCYADADAAISYATIVYTHEF